MFMGYNMKSSNTLSVLYILSGYICVHGQNHTYVLKLYTDLFTNYRKEVMPLPDHSQALTVGIAFAPSNINFFREVDETISLTAVLMLNWTDHLLAWNPSSYGYLNHTIIDPKNLWIPPTVIINRVDKIQSFGSGNRFHAEIWHTGAVSYSPGDVIETKCPTDMSKFPFDTQSCTFEILSWSIGTRYLKYSSLYDKARLEYFTENSDWILQEYSTRVVDASGYDMLSVTLKIKRRPLYFAVLVIVPTLLFALLNPLVFVLPIESGERVSLAMTILLSYIVFFTIVSASIPASSNPMCGLIILMILIIVISGIIVCGSIFGAKYYHEENIHEIGSLLQRLARWNRSKKVQPVVDHINECKKVEVNGKDVARVLDSLFFFGSYAAITFFVCGYILYINVKH